MTATAKLRDDSEFRYKGLTLNILCIYEQHLDEDCHDIYPVGSVTYKLSLRGTEWEDEQNYTVIHDGELEWVKAIGTVEANVWYDRLGKNGQNVIEDLFNPNKDKSIDDVYDAYLAQSNKERKEVCG